MTNKENRLGFDPLAWMNEEKEPSATEKVNVSAIAADADTTIVEKQQQTEKKIDGYDVEEHKMVVKKETAASVNSEMHAELVRTKGIVDNMNAAIMMIDTDLKIVYLNPSAHKMMKSVESIMQETFPFFNADKLLGVCIDDFHKNPSHQRRLLSDPSHLPYNGTIKVGPLTMSLSVTPVYDLDGKFIGACQEWVNKTEELKIEYKASRMQSALTNSQTAIMLCDENLDIIYMNDRVTQLLKAREKDLKKVFPAFDVDSLVGANIDQFHKDSSHQRKLLSDPSKLPYSSDIKILDMHFGLKATILTDKDGKYLGNAVEWTDQTEEKNAENDISHLVEKISNGILDERLDTSQYTGFMNLLGNRMNEMLDVLHEPIKGVLNVVESLEKGQLKAEMLGEYSGIFAEVQDAMNSSMKSLANMVAEIRVASIQIGSASAEISQGNADLSQRTEEQASSLEETASSMEELTSTVSQNADNSKQANQLASHARIEAEEGGKVIESTISAMTDINTASKKIEDIISVIDEIAFQTNLLALNAALEAARAGEKGRGFAVVASEVRSLAQRSAAAAKEIKALIKDSVEKVDEGSRLADESGNTLTNLVNSVKKVSDIIAEIAAASAEQASGIDQVGQAIMQLDEVTQQNAALVEEAAAASESMDEQAKSLNELVEFFDIEHEELELKKSSHIATTSSVTKTTPPSTGAKKSPSIKTAPSFKSTSTDDEWEEF